MLTSGGTVPITLLSTVSQEHKVPGDALYGQPVLDPEHLIFSQESPAALALPVTEEESTPPLSHPDYMLLRLHREYTDASNRNAHVNAILAIYTQRLLL